MFASMLLSAALSPAAPVPRGAVAPPSGAPPRAVFVRPDPTGEVRLTIYTQEKRTGKRAVIEEVDGKKTTKLVDYEYTTTVASSKRLGDLDAAFAAADGTALTETEAAARLKNGAVALVAADDKPVHAGWLRAAARDTVVVSGKNLGVAPLGTTTVARDARLVLLLPDADGRVTAPLPPPRVVAGGVGPPRPAAAEERKPLAGLAFEAYTADGAAVDRDEALRRLKAGGVALAASRLPERAFLTAFAPDLLVLVSPEFNRSRLVGAARPQVLPAAPVPVAQPAPPPVPVNKLPPKPDEK